MTTPTHLNWKSTTAEQRNDACACFMPPSDVNPLRSWHLYDGDHACQQIAAISLKDAEEKLAQHLRAANLETPASYHVVEHRRSVNYSTTTGGAWMLLDQLMAQGYMIAIAARAGLTALTAERYDERQIITPQNAPPITAFEGSEPFSELTAMLFLTLNGVKIEQ